MNYTIRIGTAEDMDLGELVGDDLPCDEALDLAQRTANERREAVVLFNDVECVEVYPK